MKVYLDNGATTKVDQKVAKAMRVYFEKSYGNASSLHFFGEEAGKALEKARIIIAKKFNAEPEEIIFTSGGTESDNLAIKGLAKANSGNRIITSQIEHPAVLNACKTLEKEGYKITYLKVDSEGFVNPKDVERAITKDTVLVTIMHANNEIGTIQPIREIGEVCKKHNVLFHTDAVQSFTKVPIDVKKINLDAASFSSHKIHGPKGVGALYLKKGAQIEKILDGGSQEFNKRAGTENIPGIVGFAEAANLPLDTKKIERLRDKLISTILREIPNTQLNGPEKNRLCNNASISFRYIEGESLLMHLNLKGVAVSTGSACSSKSLEPSHVLIAIGLKHEIAHGTIRFTLSKYTTEKEINYTVQQLKNIVKGLRKISPLGGE